jgi:hypothetical protein
MNLIRKLSIVSLFVCVLASTRAVSQAITGYAATNAGVPAQVTSAQVVPSNSASASATSIQGGHFNPKTGPSKPAHAGSIRGSLTMGAIPGEPQRLCFQSGIGWLSVPAAAFGNTGSLSAPGTIDSATLGGIAAKNSGAGGSSQSVYARLSGAKQAMSNECPGMLTNAIASGISIDEVITGKHAQSMTAVRATSMNAGAQDWLQANSVLNPASSAASQRLTMGLSSMPGGGTRVSAGTRPGVSAAQINGLKAHTYVSSIELRRMMRSAPDLQTLIKLQELQDYLAKKSRISTVTSTKDKATKQPLKQRDHNRPYSSSISSHYRHGTDSARTAYSHTQ